MPPSIQVMVPGTSSPRPPQYHAPYPGFVVRRGRSRVEVGPNDVLIPSHPNMERVSGLGADQLTTPEKIIGFDVSKRDVEGGGSEWRVSASPTTMLMAGVGAGIAVGFSALSGRAKFGFWRAIFMAGGGALLGAATSVAVRAGTKFGW